MILIVRILKVKKEDLMSYETENKISMKKFYDTIAEKYDHIFPLTPIQKKFFDEETAGTDILDIGAATGKLAGYLIEKGFNVSSIDINHRLIGKAVQKGIDVMDLDMLKIDRLKNFDTIINIGNTLPHLNSKEEVLIFLEKAYNQLKNSGRLIIQIINFRKFTNRKDENGFLGSLPLIENEHVKFERSYFLNRDNNIIFSTILDNKIENKEILLNIQHDELKGYLEKTGFKNIKTYGGFDKSLFNEKESLPFIIIGDK